MQALGSGGLAKRQREEEQQQLAWALAQSAQEQRALEDACLQRAVALSLQAGGASEQQ